MNDWELFESMNDAEKRFNELRDEFRRRGLHKKPIVEYSRRPTPAPGDLAICPVCGHESTVTQVCEECGHQWSPSA